MEGPAPAASAHTSSMTMRYAVDRRPRKRGNPGNRRQACETADPSPSRRRARRRELWACLRCWGWGTRDSFGGVVGGVGSAACSLRAPSLRSAVESVSSASGRRPVRIEHDAVSVQTSSWECLREPYVCVCIYFGRRMPGAEHSVRHAETGGPRDVAGRAGD